MRSLGSLAVVLYITAWIAAGMLVPIEWLPLFIVAPGIALLCILGATLLVAEFADLLVDHDVMEPGKNYMVNGRRVWFIDTDSGFE